MQDLKNKTILLIAPVFYDYHEMIVTQLEDQGAIVKFLPERNYGYTYGIINNTSRILLLAYQKKYYMGIVKKIDLKKIDFLFVIRGCQMPIEFISSLKEKYPKMLSFMYQWDSEKSNHFLHLRSKFDRVFSFDLKDSLNYKLEYLPLFYNDDILRIAEQKNNILYDFFVLCSYSRERYKYLTELKKRLSEFRLNFIIFIPKSSYIKERLKGVKLSDDMLTFTPINRNTYLKNLSETKTVIDISPSIQSGLPIRIIETLGAGKQLITTNQYVINEFGKLNLVHLLSEKTNFKEISSMDYKTNELNKDYSLNKWLDKIFNNN